jgi:hypothetical protein
VLRAAQGMRDSGGGLERIRDEVTRSRLRLTARRIQFAAPLAALLLTGLCLWLAAAVFNDL